VTEGLFQRDYNIEVESKMIGDTLYILDPANGLTIYKYNATGEVFSQGHFQTKGHLEQLTVQGDKVAFVHSNSLSVDWVDGKSWLEPALVSSLVLIDVSDLSALKIMLDEELPAYAEKISFIDDVLVAFTFRGKECLNCDTMTGGVTTFYPESESSYATRDTIEFPACHVYSMERDVFPSVHVAGNYLLFSCPLHDQLYGFGINPSSGLINTNGGKPNEYPVDLSYTNAKLQGAVWRDPTLYAVFTNGYPSTLYVQALETAEEGQLIISGSPIAVGDAGYDPPILTNDQVIVVNCRYSDSTCSWNQAIFEGTNSALVLPSRSVLGDGKAVFADDKFVYLSSEDELIVYDASSLGGSSPVAHLPLTGGEAVNISGFSSGNGRLTFVEKSITGEVWTHLYTVDGTNFEPFVSPLTLHAQHKVDLGITSHILGTTALYQVGSQILSRTNVTIDGEGTTQVIGDFRHVAASYPLQNDRTAEIEFDHVLGKYIFHIVTSQNESAQSPIGSATLDAPTPSYFPNKWIRCTEEICRVCLDGTLYSIDVTDHTAPKQLSALPFQQLGMPNIEFLEGHLSRNYLAVKLRPDRHDDIALAVLNLQAIEPQLQSTHYIDSYDGGVRIIPEGETLYLVNTIYDLNIIREIDLAAPPTEDLLIQTPGQPHAISKENERLLSVQYSWEDFGTNDYDSVRDMTGVEFIDCGSGLCKAAVPKLVLSQFSDTTITPMSILEDLGGMLVAMDMAEERIYALLYPSYSDSMLLLPIQISDDGKMQRGTPLSIPTKWHFDPSGCKTEITIKALEGMAVELTYPCARSRIRVDASTISSPEVISVEEIWE
jgi:hypothetical protein